MFIESFFARALIFIPRHTITLHNIPAFYSLSFLRFSIIYGCDRSEENTKLPLEPRSRS